MNPAFETDETNIAPFKEISQQQSNGPSSSPVQNKNPAYSEERSPIEESQRDVVDDICATGPEQDSVIENQKDMLNDDVKDVLFVYQDAAIYLNEGLDNDRFDNHPTQHTITWYNIAHSTWYNILDLMASTLLLALGLAEHPFNGALPTSNVLSLGAPVHGILEVTALSMLACGAFVKMKWQGLKSFFTHKRSLAKFLVLCVMYIEAIVVVIRSKNHVRVTRALRPLFLIDSFYLRGVRRTLRQVMLSLPPILDMLVLLLFFIFIFAMLGFYLFSSNQDDEYFTTFERSFISLFVLLTTANYPDVMMPSYAKSRWSVIFFIAYISVALYFLMNLLLAVVYDTFTSIEKDKFRKLFLHKRHAARRAYTLLCSKDPPHWISLKQFLGLMKFFKPNQNVLHNYIVFKSLDKEERGALSLDDFYNVFEKKELSWKKMTKHDNEWFYFIKVKCKGLYYILKGIHWLICQKAFDYFIYIVIIANGCSFVVEIIMLSKMPSSERPVTAISTHWYSTVFIALYGTEALLKIIGLGAKQYFRSGWNCFDFIVTVLGIIGAIGASAKSFSIAFIVCLRPLRLLLLFKLKQRYRDVLDTIWVLMPRMFRVALVILCLYYSYGIIGLECFSGLKLKNCCNGTSVDVNYRESGYYYLNNFDDLLHAFVTLFELTVVNNWFIIMEGVVNVTSDWSRIYFMSFFIITMVVMTIVVAFVLEAFLFRIQYRKRTTNEEVEMAIKTEINVSYEEIRALDPQLVEQEGVQEGETVTYRGKRHKTKMDFSIKMYSDEVQAWVNSERVYNLTNALRNQEVTADDDYAPELLTQRYIGSLPRGDNSFQISSREQTEGARQRCHLV
ncbi:two pore channel protein 1 isoform X2 [Nematostella vectensis]|uniref:two pore channel protein 1 isoform X2 n=1 Tax=Nematostella vectensis TaxID=45351 RepID=UPI00207733DF|nr:two pore channel protein 1 isoform X2 [Nematostella vectensis]